VLNWAPHREDVWSNGGIAPRILNFGPAWRWVFSFRSRPLEPWDGTPVPAEQKAVWDPEPVWTVRRRERPLSLLEFETELPDHAVHCTGSAIPGPFWFQNRYNRTSRQVGRFLASQEGLCCMNLTSTNTVYMICFRHIQAIVRMVHSKIL
jgi:hypothetical protein